MAEKLDRLKQLLTDSDIEQMGQEMQRGGGGCGREREKKGGGGKVREFGAKGGAWLRYFILHPGAEPCTPGWWFSQAGNVAEVAR